MKYKLQFSFIFSLLMLFVTSLSAQMKKSEVKSLIIKGDNLIWSGRYNDAKEVFTELSTAFPENKIYQFRIAICNTQSLNYKKAALDTLESLEKSKSKSELDDFDYHIATAYYFNYNFIKAKEHYEKYYNHIKSSGNTSLSSHIQLLMDYNNNALILCKDTLANIRVTNLKTPLNTLNQEYSPYVNPSEDIMILTYLGEKSQGGKMTPTLKQDDKYGRYYEDILISYRDSNSLWTEPKSIEGINTKNNEAAAGISINGDHLFVFQSINSTNGDIYESFLDENKKWSSLSPVRGINSPDWEGSAAISVDGETIYFSSNRAGGYGGIDLYSGKLQSNGSWGEIKNLGPEINTMYDEDSPYIHPDNVTLYFSSNGTGSIGKYDVFYAEKQDNGKFHDITNAGIPINTLNDDRFYILSADGQTGYFAKESDRDSKDQDIYIITPGKIGAPPLLALINGKVFLDNLNEQATIIVRDRETGKIQGRYKTNPNSDMFTMLLNPGKNYIMDIEVNGEIKYSDSLNSDFVDQFIQLSHDYYVYSDDFKGDKLVLQFSLQDKVQQVYNEATGYSGIDTNTVLQHTFITTRKDTLKLHDLNSIVKQNRIDFYQKHQDLAKKENITQELLSLAQKNEFTDNIEYKKENGFAPQYHNSPNDILANKVNNGKPTAKEQSQLNAIFHPTFKATDVVFRVQVAAYKKPKNFQWKGRSIYGDVLEVTYPDGITRFTIGGTKHLEEIEELRLKLIHFGIEDAFVVAFQGEERIPLYQYKKLNK